MFNSQSKILAFPFPLLSVMKRICIVLLACSVLGASRSSAQPAPSPAFPVPTPSVRQAPAKRKFTSEAVEKEIVRVKAAIADPVLAHIFEMCYPNTLDTTVTFDSQGGKPDTFVITGDIAAMWLRDSSAQVQGYLPLCPQDPHLAQMIAGLIHRQDACILIDPYANAFFRDTSKSSPHRDDTDVRPGVFERKWELDSLCYCIRLAYQYWKITGDAATFDAQWRSAMHLAVATMHDQQRKAGQGLYCFIRGRRRPGDDGYGSPFKPVGMICTRFRNSDDPTVYQFNIPDELFAVESLHHLAEMFDALAPGDGLAADCRSLAQEVAQGIQQYGIVNDPKRGKMFAYECDGLGHTLVMEDAGNPSLLSIPYFSPALAGDPLVLASRKYALSTDDPWFFRGTAAEGTGSQHKGKNMIWPLGLVMQALTSNDQAEITACLGMLKNSSAGTGFMHESFNKDNPLNFSRKWFAWVNNLFGELIIKILREHPDILAKPIPEWRPATA